MQVVADRAAEIAGRNPDEQLACAWASGWRAYPAGVPEGRSLRYSRRAAHHACGVSRGLRWYRRNVRDDQAGLVIVRGAALIPSEAVWIIRRAPARDQSRNTLTARLNCSACSSKPAVDCSASPTSAAFC